MADKELLTEGFRTIHDLLLQLIQREQQREQFLGSLAGEIKHMAASLLEARAAIQEIGELRYQLAAMQQRLDREEREHHQREDQLYQELQTKLLEDIRSQSLKMAQAQRKGTRIARIGIVVGVVTTLLGMILAKLLGFL